MITEQTLDAIFESRLGGGILAFIPFAVLALSSYLFRRQPIAVNVISAVIFTATALFFCQFSAIQWYWRDGLGQDAIESHGIIAVSRFVEGFWPVLAMSAFLFSLGLLPIIVFQLSKKLRKT